MDKGSKALKKSVSKKMFNEAKRYIPGGVNSPVRAYKAVGGDPLFIKKAKGSKIYDVDGNEYIDYVMSWGALILGHAQPKVANVATAVLNKGTSFGAPTEAETELAKMIVRAFESIDLVRFVNSGTEAVMTAVRLARAYTRRDKIIKFEGCYHGHSDTLLVKAGSGAATLGIPDSPGVTESVAGDTLVLSYNDIENFGKMMEESGEQIACVIVEPVAANMGLILPKQGFLQSLRSITQKFKTVLIFDEVISGFRVTYGGAQAIYNVVPDLTCLGKIIGGGFPVGALGGKKEIMEYLAPLGPVYQAGTLSGNPVAMAAGIETLKMLSGRKIYASLEAKALALEEGFRKNAKQAGVNIFCARIASMLSLFFTDKEVFDYNTAKMSDTNSYAVYFKNMLENGVYLAPSQFETMFVSVSHRGADIEKTILASKAALRGASLSKRVV
jgi:glutamate-1-semialdehyde 2,1-aminomutase